MKTIAFLDQINNGYALLLLGEDEEEAIDVKLYTLAQYIEEPLKEGDVLEIIFSKEREVIFENGRTYLIDSVETCCVLRVLDGKTRNTKYETRNTKHAFIFAPSKINWSKISL